MTRTYVKHATLLKCFIKSGTNWIAGIIWLQRSVLLKLLKLEWIGHTAMMDKAFWSVIFSSDNLLVKLKLLLSEEDPWEIYLVGIRLTAFADGYLGEENFPSFSIFMLSPLPLSFLSTLNITLLFPLFVHFLLIFIQRLFHTFYFLCFSNIFKSLPNPGLLWHIEESSSNMDDEEKPEYSTVQRNPHINLILSEGL